MNNNLCHSGGAVTVISVCLTLAVKWKNKQIFVSYCKFNLAIFKMNMSVSERKRCWTLNQTNISIRTSDAFVGCMLQGYSTVFHSWTVRLPEFLITCQFQLARSRFPHGLNELEHAKVVSEPLFENVGSTKKKLVSHSLTFIFKGSSI